MAVPYLQVDNLTKSFGDLVLFENISFGIAEGQRVGLIAKNGTGKTTLLNVIAGKEGYDNGNIVFRRDLRVDYLEQDPQYPEELTVLEACFHHGNSTVELIKEYERCMETDGHPGMDELLVRMDQEEAWEYEQKAKQILSQLKIRNFDQKAPCPRQNTCLASCIRCTASSTASAERAFWVPLMAVRKRAYACSQSSAVVAPG